MEALLMQPTPPPERRNDPEAEYNRLMHTRKGMSGSEFAGVGMQFAITLVLFTLAGVWLDRRLGTSPWLLIILALGGSALAFWGMYRRMISSGKK
jgi:F0F1-type ATP synthase assembly protein I